MAKAPQAKIVPLTEFTLDQANTRRHPERNRATIRASLDQFGAARSVVADRNNVIRAGNGTLEQAIEAGMEALVVEPKPNQLVVVKRPDWTPTQAIAYGVADNRAGDLAENDDAALATVLRGLQSEDFDLAAVGFDGAEVDALIDGLANEAGGGLGGGPSESVGDPRKSLGERFGVPPFSVLDARQGYWQDRKRLWLSLGIQSEIGRGGDLMDFAGPSERQKEYPPPTPALAAARARHATTGAGNVDEGTGGP